MRSTRNASALQCLVALIALASAPAAAQEASADATARARDLFAEGVQCVQREDWACAEDRFRQALELREAPAVRYNLASAIYEQGRYPEAAALNRQVLDDPETTPEIRQHAIELREAMNEEGALARVVVTGAPEDAELRVDGYALSSEDWAEVPVAPGSRTFALYSGDRQLSEIHVEAEGGRPLSVALNVVASPEEAAQGGGGGGIDTAIFEDPIFWGVVGGSVAVVIIVIVIVAVAASAGTEGPIEGDFQPGVLTW
ncbi:MAG: hypothetical protein H6719_15200 [Sandaracinaceae bacterium]|nr:hypothetical protein [Sandaracinaceae bacterium]